MKTDRKKEFKNRYWAQGYLLNTTRTRELPQLITTELDRIERKMCFVGFLETDEGRSRTLIYIYSTADKCKKAVEKHNNELWRKREYGR